MSSHVAGREQFTRDIYGYLGRVDAVMAVYDVTDFSSLHSVQQQVSSIPSSKLRTKTEKKTALPGVR